MCNYEVTCWADFPEYHEFVKEKMNYYNVSTLGRYVLKEKLKMVKGDLKEWSSIFLWVLLPKNERSWWLSNFMRISFLECANKVVAKVLTAKLKEIGKVLLDTHTTFVIAGQILDSILVVDKCQNYDYFTYVF